MKAEIHPNRRIGYLAIIPALAGLACLQIGCEKMKFWQSKPSEMHTTSDVSPSEGTVRTSDGDNGNLKVSIRVKHLAPPSKSAPDATVYIVWIQPQDGERQNAGALTVNSNLEGSLDTLTSQRRFTITVTPEANGQVAQPSHNPVFSYNVESAK